MALTYLSGIDSDYIGAFPRSGRNPNRERRAARAKAREEAGRAILAARRALALQRIAEKKIMQANRATQQAAALNMDEIGRRGGRAERQERRQERRQANQEARAKRQEARQVAKAAKKQAQTARRAAAQAAKAQRAAKRLEARTARKAARTTARTTRKTTRATTRATKRGGAAPLPEAPDAQFEDEIIEEEAPMFEAEETEEPEEFLEAEEVESDEELGYNYLGLDEIGGRRKDKRQAKRAARKQKRKDRRDKRGGSIVKKIALAPARAAFLLLLKTNALKLRTRLRQAWVKDKNAVITKLVKRFGFKQENFLKELNRKESQQLSGALGEPAVATALATAAPIIAAVAQILRSLGIKSNDLEKTARDNGATGEEFTDIPGAPEGAPGRSNTGLLLVAAGAAALLLFSNRK